MNLFIVLICFSVGIPIFVLSTDAESGVRKCCDSGEVFESINGSYTCIEDKTRRLQMKSDETGFLHRNETGECVEIIEEFFVFNVSRGIVQPLGQVIEQIFPKCCPLNHVYNTEIHSCQEATSLNHSYISQDFLQIGLPNCKVIVDYELNENSIHKRNNKISINSYCIDKSHTDSYVLRECKDSVEICEEIRCFKKCCPDGQSFINGPNCYDTYKYGLNLSRWQNFIENYTGNRNFVY